MNVLIGFMLVRAHDRLFTLALFTIVMLFKFLITDRSLHRIHKREYDRIGRWLLMAAVLFGCGLGFAGAIPEFAPAAVQAFIARGVLLNVFWEELPRQRQSRLGTFTGAALLFGAALILLRTSI